MRNHLAKLAEPTLKKIMDHPYWTGLVDGSLPAPALEYFVQQDGHHLLPAYARAAARLAAVATDDSHTLLLSKFAGGTLEARNGMMLGFGMMAKRFGFRADGSVPPIGPTTHAYSGFLTADPTLAGALGALAPCAWFHIQVADQVFAQHDPTSTYGMWIKGYHPGDDYRQVLGSFLNVLDEVAEQASESERDRMAHNFQIGARYEWAFAEAALTTQDWPV